MRRAVLFVLACTSATAFTLLSPARVAGHLTTRRLDCAPHGPSLSITAAKKKKLSDLGEVGSASEQELADAAVRKRNYNEYVAELAAKRQLAAKVQREASKSALLKLGITSCRGERASTQDRVELRRLVDQLAQVAIKEDMKQYSCEGEWDLVMSDTQLFRSSPFFMAARAVVPDGSQADQFNWFCDQHRAALDFSQIGRVRQVVKNGELRSVFEVKAGLSPLAFGLPVSVSGAIVTTADIVSDVGDVYGDVAGWRLAIKSVQVENSNIPLLKEALDDWLQLPIPQITNALEATPLDVETWRPMPLFRTRRMRVPLV